MLISCSVCVVLNGTNDFPKVGNSLKMINVPVTARTEGKLQTIYKIVQKNRHLSLRMVTDIANTIKVKTGTNLDDELNIKVFTK